MRSLHGSNQFKGYGGHDGYKESITKSQKEADDNDPLKCLALRDHHAHEAQKHERGNLKRQSIDITKITVTEDKIMTS